MVDAERRRGEAWDEGLELARGPVEDPEKPFEAACRADLSILRSCLIGEYSPVRRKIRRIQKGQSGEQVIPFIDEARSLLA